MSREEEFRNEINKLSKMGKEIDELISKLREEQNEIKSLLQHIEASSFQSGKAKEAFFKRVEEYYESYSKKVQIVEDAETDIFEAKRLAERLLQQEIMKPDNPLGKF